MSAAGRAPITQADAAATARAGILPSGGVPRYIQLATLFRRQIASGQWQTGDQIPTVEDLSEQYTVARATVRQALGILEAEGLIERFRAKGTFVTYQPQEQLWCEVETDWNGLLRSREGAEIELLSESIGAQPPAFLHPVGERARSYRLIRRRHWRGGQPFLVADSYFDESIWKRVPPEALTSKSALNLLASIRGLKIGDVRQTLTIGAADVEIADMLQIPLNSPVAYVHRSAMDGRGRLVFISDGTYRGDVVRLDMKLR